MRYVQTHIKHDTHSYSTYEELANLTKGLANEQALFIGDAWKYKIAELPTPLSPEYFKKETVEVFCHSVHDKIVSFLAISFAANMVGIDYLYTVPEYRNKGLMTDLFNMLFKTYPKEQHYFFLHTYVKNVEAMKLYKKLGFTSNYVTMEL